MEVFCRGGALLRPLLLISSEVDIDQRGLIEEGSAIGMGMADGDH